MRRIQVLKEISAGKTSAKEIADAITAKGSEISHNHVALLLNGELERGTVVIASKTGEGVRRGRPTFNYELTESGKNEVGA